MSIQSHNTNPTGAISLIRGGNYPITSSWSNQSLIASFVSGSLTLEGSDGYFPMYSGSSLTYKSSLLDDGVGVYSSKPVYATNLPSKVIQTTGSVKVSLITDKFIPIVIGGKLYKLALVQ